jgi:hypothetical protein
LLAALVAYLLLTIPLPYVVLDHELGLLTGDPAHTAVDDHAWLDHAAGAGIASSDTATPLVDLVVSLVPAGVLSHESVRTHAPSVRGPPACLS